MLTQRVCRILNANVTVRNLSIVQASSVSSEKRKDLEQPKLLSSIDDIGVNQASKPVFQVIGSPATVLNVSIPPSYPLYVSKGSIISLNSKDKHSVLDSLVSQTRLINPIKRTLFGLINFRYEKIFSTIPFNALVSSSVSTFSWGSSSKIVRQRSFVSLDLDGRLDWAVFPPKAVQAYAGDNLTITNPFLPKSLTKFPRVYTLISGRGLLSLTGEGQIYKITLGNETILIRKENLLAISVNGNSEIPQSLKNVNLNKELKEGSREQISSRPVLKYFSQAKDVITSSYRYLTGNNQYIKVHGPRTLLLSTNSQLESFHYKNGQGSENYFSLAKSIGFANPEPQSKDYLKVVTIEKGEIKGYESRNSFLGEQKQQAQ
ncbi:Altered inheritance of mitochondria protein 24, mitochondrial [Komagataella kurtzmanii]|nr:Altered inheritance of mitochondria protein 24, mitochondrial [Komagataella kurtzmanii]